jgi:Lrp/AsnC family transcriptional regulator for asnA, asnC and gidA
MDKLDLLILNELLKDAQQSFVKIAKKLGTSSNTIITRYNRMKQQGLIYKCTLSIDLSKLGYQGKVFLLITLMPNKSKSETLSALKKIRNVIVVTEILGPFDLLAIAPVINLNSVRELVKEVKRSPNVQRVEMACINDIYFPISPSFGKVLSRKCYERATA